MESVVIGAASGMGTAVARRLAARGPMVIADRDREPLERLAKELGDDVEVAVCDITQPDQVEGLFDGLDSVTSLVVTAGIAAVSGAPGRQILEVNLRGTRHVLDAFDPFVREGTSAVCFASAGAYLVPDTPEVRRSSPSRSPPTSSTSSPRPASTSTTTSIATTGRRRA